MYQTFFKRFFDIIISLLGILILVPLMIFVILLLAYLNKGTPFFIQKRPGKDEVVFSVIKLKTMSDATDNNGVLLSDTERLTSFGRIIRKTSLDETPQLVNVLFGSMSLIGPRPLLCKYLPFYYPEERLRHSVRPGITGWAQVNGRNMVSWNERLKMDIEYVEKVSLFLDFKIIIKTVKRVLFPKSLVIDTSTTMLDLDVERKFKN
jgi:lipopolysaccharide/colanic/teichoic acid biosynthesis glycosyltransferase